MSESFEDIDLYSMNLEPTVFATEVMVAKAEMILAPHLCANINHRVESLETLLVLIFKDENQKMIPIAFHPESTVAAAFLSCGVCKSLRFVAETC